MRINEDTRQGLKYSPTRGFVPQSLVLVSRQLLPMLKINFECLIRPDEISNSVRAEPVEALRQAQGERFKLHRAGSIARFLASQTRLFALSPSCQPRRRICPRLRNRVMLPSAVFSTKNGPALLSPTVGRWWRLFEQPFKSWSPAVSENEFPRVWMRVPISGCDGGSAQTGQ